MARPRIAPCDTRGLRLEVPGRQAGRAERAFLFEHIVPIVAVDEAVHRLQIELRRRRNRSQRRRAGTAGRWRRGRAPRPGASCAGRPGRSAQAGRSKPRPSARGSSIGRAEDLPRRLRVPTPRPTTGGAGGSPSPASPPARGGTGHRAGPGHSRGRCRDGRTPGRRRGRATPAALRRRRPGRSLRRSRPWRGPSGSGGCSSVSALRSWLRAFCLSGGQKAQSTRQTVPGMRIIRRGAAARAW